ncbi:MAG: DUF58 domain-containing protein [Actinomycetota bacterium]
MTPTRFTIALLALAALSGFFVPIPVAGLIVAAVLVAAAVDAIVVRDRPSAARTVPMILSRGVASQLTVEADRAGARAVHLRQPGNPDVVIEPREAVGRLDATVVAKRRGRHELAPVAIRRVGPLGLGAWTHGAVGDAQDVLVFPDLVTAYTLAIAVRRGRFRDAGLLSRGPLGLGTDFESIREYLPDDDVRQVNWLATARMGRPMSNQLRIEQDRDVMCVLDTGRLMTAPLRDRTRMDAAVDAAAAVAFVADAVGDRCGALAFDAVVHRRLRPRRSGGEAVVRSIFDLEPTSVDSDYELAFRSLGEAKRAFVIVFTDLLEVAAARPLYEAVPVLARRHHVAVASVVDPDITDIIGKDPARAADVYEKTVALDVLNARSAVVRRLRAVGADVIEAPPERLAAACVAAYLRAKSRALL